MLTNLHVQLALEQHGCELHGSSYSKISFSCCRRAQELVASVHMEPQRGRNLYTEELYIQRADSEVTRGFSPTLTLLQVNCMLPHLIFPINCLKFIQLVSCGTLI